MAEVIIVTDTDDITVSDGTGPTVVTLVERGQQGPPGGGGSTELPDDGIDFLDPDTLYSAVLEGLIALGVDSESAAIYLDDFLPDFADALADPDSLSNLLLNISAVAGLALVDALALQATVPGQVQSLQNSVATNTNDIADLQGDLADAVSDIAGNTSAISTNAGAASAALAAHKTESNAHAANKISATATDHTNATGYDVQAQLDSLDAALTTRIASVTQAYQDADDVEVAARETAISGEAAARGTAVSNEAQARTDGDNALDTRLATVETNMPLKADLIDGLVPTEQLPTSILTEVFEANSQSAMLALPANKGDACIRTDVPEAYLLANDPATTLANWKLLPSPTSPVVSVNGQIGLVVLGYTDVGAPAATHAGQHATGGTDPISPASIGALAANDTSVTNTRTPTDGTVTPTSFAASAKDPVAATAGARTLGTGSQQAAAGNHTHTAADVGADPAGTGAYAVQRANHTGTQSADTVTDGTTNKAYTATEKTKLAGVATAATANDTDANLKARANHTGTQSADTLTDGTTNKAFLATERTKLSGIASGATANSSDATLLARANHTGTQAPSTITGTAVITTDTRLSDTRTPTDATVTSAKLTSALLDQLGREIIATSDLGRSSTTTVADDPVLAFNVGAGETWRIRAWISYSGDPTADFRCGINLPASSTCELSVHHPAPNATAQPTAVNTSAITAAGFVSMGCIATPLMALIEGWVTTTASGSIAISWAQLNSNATATVRRAGSSLQYRRTA